MLSYIRIIICVCFKDSTEVNYQLKLEIDNNSQFQLDKERWFSDAYSVINYR